MIVQVGGTNGGLPELCILEFQGELVGEKVGMLGSLTLKAGEKVEMIIGNHFLEGSFQNLKSPLLVLDSNDSTDDTAASTAAPSLSIQGVVRRKIIFKTRPKPAGKRTREQADLL